MSYLQIFFVYSVFIGVTFGAEKCGDNEFLDHCPSDCAYDYCPKNELHDRIPCPKPKQCPPPACKCAFNYRRENGTCIPTADCPPFTCDRPNEYFEPCPPYCPAQNCDSATPTGECLFFLSIVVTCSPSCRCVRDHWRKDGVCVPYHECFK